MSIQFPFDIIHDTKGAGKALGISEDGEYVKILFTNYTLEDFAYPDQFMIHIRAKNPDIQKEIEELYAEMQDTLPPTPHRLVAGQLEGTRGIDIYDKYCRIFGWDSSLRYNFDSKQRALALMYAKNATPEGYSVWMVVHTDLSEKYNKNSRWFNFICRDQIKEVWFINDHELLQDTSIRVTFVRTKEGYRFQGIYKPIKIERELIKGKMELVRTFERISTCYPEENNPPKQHTIKDVLVGEYMISPDNKVGKIIDVADKIMHIKMCDKPNEIKKVGFSALTNPPIGRWQAADLDTQRFILNLIKLM